MAELKAPRVAPALPTPDLRSRPLISAILGVYVFLLMSRLMEFVGSVAGSDFSLTMAVTIIATLLTLVNGRVLAVLSARQGWWILAFTGWLLLTTLTSQWHFGSVTMLKDQWSRSLLVFLVIFGLTTSLGQFRKLLKTLGYATAVAALLMLVTGNVSYGRFAGQTGTFGNANKVAFHLLIGLPFCIFIIKESRWLVRIFMGAVIGLMVLLIFRTGSRGGLLMLGLVVLAGSLFVSLANKVKILVAAGALAAVVWVSLPAGVLDRYRTLVSNESAGSSAFASAVESGDQRMFHLRESLELTLHNPILGVGPGVFQAISADYEKSKGLPPLWLETHNTYTQVSSECGIPGLLLFIGLQISNWLSVLRIRRAARAAGNTEVMTMTSCLMLSLLVFAVDGFFDSIAYSYYLPLLAGLITVLEFTARPVWEVNRTVVPTGQPAVRVAGGIRPLPSLARNPVPGMRIGFGGMRPARRTPVSPEQPLSGT